MQAAYPAYQKQLREANAVDFDDLLMHVATMLQESDELRASLDHRYRYILIDEYQDTNLAQYAIARSISIDYPNLMVTGDPDQSIYGWRGANLRNILEFEADYPDVRVVRLEQNYRSTPKILAIADTLISRNRRRKQKRLFTDNDDGPAPRLIEYPTQKEEAEEIAAQIAAQLRSGERSPGDFAILYRMNALSRAFEHAFRDQRIPYQIVRGVEFYQRQEVKDVIAYLRLINNPHDVVALLRIINVPARGIGKKTIDRIRQAAAAQGDSMLAVARDADQLSSISKAYRKRVQEFAELMDRLSKLSDRPVREIMQSVLDETGYLEILRDSSTAGDDNRADNVEELLTAAEEFDRNADDESGLEAFLEEVSLVNDVDDLSPDDRVTLMTLHAAKGLEFPVVYIVAVERGILPHDRSMGSNSELEEERRLLFVGITRAERELQLSHVRFRNYRGAVNRSAPSDFLMELPRESMEVVGLDPMMLRPDLQHEAIEASWSPVRSSPRAERANLPVDLNAAIRTAADLLSSASDASSPSTLASSQEAVDPSQFEVGMAVLHPEYGLGKIESLSGAGKKRTGTVNFATAGKKTIVLAFSGLRPTLK